MDDAATLQDIGALSPGRIGDGKLWGTEVEQVVLFRTGEMGPDAV